MLNGVLVGFGNIAQSSHLPAYADERISALAQLVAVVEPDADNRRISAERFPQLNFYDSLELAVERETIDFLDITAPPKFHRPLIEHGIDFGLHMISEKPFTRTLEEAQELSRRLAGYNKVFMPCHQYKYSPLWRQFKTAVAEIPPTQKIMLQFNVVRRQADPGLEIFANTWRTNKETSGGGILADTGVHYLYLTTWLLGKPLAVSCHTASLTHTDYPVEDTAVMHIECERGIAEITLTWAGNRRYNSAMLTSNSVSLHFEGGDRLIKTARSGEHIIPIPDPADKKTYAALYVDLFSEFFNTIKNGNMNPAWLDEAFQSIRLLEYGYQSASSGKVCFLGDE